MATAMKTRGPERDSAGEPLMARAFAARQLALRRLIELRSPEGNWFVPLELAPFVEATYITAIRTAGLVGAPGEWEREAALVRRIVDQSGPDGGFSKFPGSPPSASATRLCVAALRLALGDARPGPRPPAWFAANPALGEAVRRRTQEAVARASTFLARRHSRTPLISEADLYPPSRILPALASWEGSMPWLPVPPPRLVAWLLRSPRLSQLARHLTCPLREILPAFSILYAAARRRGQPLPCRTQAAVQEIAHHLRQSQDDCGGWLYNAFHTAVNLMALAVAGGPPGGPAVTRAHAFLANSIRPAEDGGAFVSYARSDLADTGTALDCCLRIPGHQAEDAEARPAVEFLLRWQAPGGGFGWGSGFRKTTDADSTAQALRGLAMAARTSQGTLRDRILDALRRGVAFMCSRQNRGGGLSIWDTTFARSNGGSLAPVMLMLFDPPTPDTTARVVETLARMGVDARDGRVRGALGFLLRTQSRNGAWWSRWWAGYLVGAAFVLRAYASLGLRYDGAPPARDALLARSHAALRRAARFILEHQNTDGGWGETVRSDEDEAYAGRGESTPLHTAYMLSALLRCGYPPDTPAIRGGVEHLLRTMTADGRWEDAQVTFTISFRSLYYPYAFLSYVVPLDALTDYLQACGAEPRAAESET